MRKNKLRICTKTLALSSACLLMYGTKAKANLTTLLQKSNTARLLLKVATDRDNSFIENGPNNTTILKLTTNPFPNNNSKLFVNENTPILVTSKSPNRVVERDVLHKGSKHIFFSSNQEVQIETNSKSKNAKLIKVSINDNKISLEKEKITRNGDLVEKGFTLSLPQNKDESTELIIERTSNRGTLKSTCLYNLNNPELNSTKIETKLGHSLKTIYEDNKNIITSFNSYYGTIYTSQTDKTTKVTISTETSNNNLLKKSIIYNDSSLEEQEFDINGFIIRELYSANGHLEEKFYSSNGKLKKQVMMTMFDDETTIESTITDDRKMTITQNQLGKTISIIKENRHGVMVRQEFDEDGLPKERPVPIYVPNDTDKIPSMEID